MPQNGATWNATVSIVGNRVGNVVFVNNQFFAATELGVMISSGSHITTLT